MPASQVIQPAQQNKVAPKGQQQPRGQLISFVVINDQQPGALRLVTFILILTRYFNPLSVASTTCEESQHNISGLSSSFLNLLSVMSYQQINTAQSFSPTNLYQHPTSPPTTQEQESQQPDKPHPLQQSSYD